MNATGLPIPALTTPNTLSGTEQAAAPSAAASPASDFVMALAQLLGAAVPASASAQAHQLGLQAEASDKHEPDPADAMALLPLPIVLPEAVHVLPETAADSADPLELLGLNARPQSAAARDAALLQAMTERLAVVDSEAQQSQTTTGTLAPTDVASQTRLASSEAMPAHARPLQHPVGTQAWADELGSRLTMMTEKGQHTASLRLSPEHLGPLEVRIAMRDDQASVWFGAAHADTRAAIEHALPRLREMFEAQGVVLADAGVFREPPKQHEPHSTSSNDATTTDPSAPNESTTTTVQVKVGLVDAYA